MRPGTTNDGARSGRRVAYWLRLAFSLAIITIACVIDAVHADEAAAPDFALRSLDRGNQRLSEYRGDVVVLGFWASWCGDCRRRLPELNSLYERHRGQGLVMLGINLDRDPQRARDFARVLGLDFPVLLDADGVVGRLYEVEDVPRIVVIDRDGAVRHVFGRRDQVEAGGDWQSDIVALLGE